ncbi:MAG: CoA pyrophosphatase [Gemmatimonadetes bacterium]|nr:CoA pyrophosphatase [Gemmatimonadota bacterium]
MTVSAGELDPRFLALRAALAPVSAHRGPHSAKAQGPPRTALEAAVTLILRATPELELLLIKRARSERDPWSGHMALPGGRRDPEDASLLHTAFRETFEETGIDLERLGAVLGRLDQLSPLNRRLPQIEITPFVVGVPPDTPARPASPEVDAALWVPLASFTHPSATRSVLIDVSGEPRSFPSFRVGDEIVWGLTYRILSQFLRHLPRE